MNKDDISAIITAVGVISLIVGFGIYFNSHNNNFVNSSQKEQLEKSILKSSVKTGDVITVKLNKTDFLNIDRTKFLKAPELVGLQGYINTPNNQPLKLSDLKGKVVLLDFWTYTCINCIRTIPYLNDWYNKYSDNGLVVVGVHSPEFDFEKKIENVKDAVNKFGIKYPVVLDSDHKTWDAYQNKYWPRDYIIDSEGYIRDDHIGEGGYNETEKVIQALLAEKAALDNKTKIVFNMNKGTLSGLGINTLEYTDFTKRTTPEIYLGYSFARAPIGNPEGFKPEQEVNYSIDQNNTHFDPNIVYLEGTWKNNKDNMELTSNDGKIILTYFAKAINIVASGNGQTVTVLENGTKTIALPNSGKDVSYNGSVIVDKQRLYNLGLYEDYKPRSIVLDVKGKGFQIYTFTFG